MSAKNGYSILLVLWSAACSSPRPSRPVVVSPVPSIPVPITAASTSWTFNLLPGTATYRVSRTGVVENKSDSATRREVSTSSSHESITLLPSGDTIGFTAVVDTFSTTSQGMVTAAQQDVVLPFQLSGFLIGDSIRISNDSLNNHCNPVATALITDLHYLLAHFPASLSTTSRWRDSTNVIVCRGSIPVRSRATHSYAVAGETLYEGVPVLVVQRADTIHAEGEGAQQQHRMVVTADGAGSATFYLDTRAGHVIHLTVDQNFDLMVSASGRANHFRQTAKQDFTLVR
jgi:hypothetical protein